MARYQPGEAREWAKDGLRGVAGCLSCTFRSDLSGLNEVAIRHDIELQTKYGFAATLIVAENGTTPAEMRELIDITVEQASGRLLTIVHATAPTLEDNVELLSHAERAGVDLVLPSFPLTFYPAKEDEVYAYFKALADSTWLGMIVFAIGLWNFARLHPSGFSPDLIGRLISDCPNVVAVKNEIGLPGIAGMSQVFERYADEVVITDPLEMNAPAWVRSYGMQFLGTSNYDYMGPSIPRMFELLQDRGRYEEAMDLYWGLHPARQANMRVMGEAVAGTSLVPRLVWKYQGWLSGFNGGPIRSPQGRINDAQMRDLRAGLAGSGLPVPDLGDDAFFVGRNPD